VSRDRYSQRRDWLLLRRKGFYRNGQPWKQHDERPVVWAEKKLRKAEFSRKFKKLQRKGEILERKKELAFPFLASEGKGKKKVWGESVEREGRTRLWSASTVLKKNWYETYCRRIGGVILCIMVSQEVRETYLRFGGIMISSSWRSIGESHVEGSWPLMKSNGENKCKQILETV
jgi:hypothetical protein